MFQGQVNDMIGPGWQGPSTEVLRGTRASDSSEMGGDKGNNLMTGVEIRGGRCVTAWLRIQKRHRLTVLDPATTGG